jgi:hypothetical protein
MKKIFVGVLALSLLLNVVLAGALLYLVLQGSAETPDGRMGVLVRDIEVGRFNETNTVFTLPRGLVVREASATGADWFEPYRFRLVITSDDDALVDYSPRTTDLPSDREYYSADVAFRRKEEAKYGEDAR